MKVVKTVIISLVAVAAAVAATFFAIGYFREKPGGVLIDTSPVSNVYIDGSLVGKTPYTGTFKAGEITLKLVPESSDQNLVVYETKVTLVAGIQTVIRREFGDTEETSADDIISFDKVGGGETGLVVISIPTNAQISVDGLPQGFTPYKTTNISPAEHQIEVKAPGYTNRVMALKTIEGFRLSLFAKLAKVIEPKSTPSPAPDERTYIQILSTPTGFLRVRTAPGTAGSEIAQVKPGEKYPFLDEDVATGWVEIQYEATAPGLPNGITGWVSGQFTKKILPVGESTSSAALK